MSDVKEGSEPPPPASNNSDLIAAMRLTYPEVSEQTLDAFINTDRRVYLPDAELDLVYKDDAVVTHWRQKEIRQETASYAHQVAISSSSQPSLMAHMLDMLELKPGMKVLELGAATGYNAALIARIVGQRNVATIDIDEALTTAARLHLAANGLPDVNVITADAWDGFPSTAPYDRIVATFGCYDIAPNWFEQLRDGGVLVLPLTFQCIEFVCKFRKHARALVLEDITLCYFIDMRGAHARRMFQVYANLAIVHDAITQSEMAWIATLLGDPAGIHAYEPTHAIDASDRKLTLYLSLAYPLTFLAQHPGLSELTGRKDPQLAIADPEQGGIAASAFYCGPDETARSFQTLVQDWLDAGSPGSKRLNLTVYPKHRYPDRSALARENRNIFAKKHSWLAWRFDRDERNGDSAE